MCNDEIAELKPQIIILLINCIDLVCCAAAKVWKAYVDAPMLGLSATNIRYLDNCWNRADKLFDDYIANKIALGKTIIRRSFNPPKYIGRDFGKDVLSMKLKKDYNYEHSSRRNRICRTFISGSSVTA